MLRFNGNYFIGSIILLVVRGILMGRVLDQFISPYIGDVLLILIMYTFIKSFVSKPTKKLPYYLLAVTCVLTLFQLQLERGSFDMNVILAYSVGAGLLVVWEQVLRKNIAYL